MQVIYADEFSRIALGGLSTIITKRSLYVEEKDFSAVCRKYKWWLRISRQENIEREERGRGGGVRERG